jgi:hypothetical protein
MQEKLTLQVFHIVLLSRGLFVDTFSTAKVVASFHVGSRKKQNRCVYEIYYFIFNKTAVTIKQPIGLFPQLII